MANLTRYTVFQNEHCDWNCGLMPQHDGPLVKFEDIKEFLPSASTNTGSPKLPSPEECINEIGNRMPDGACTVTEKQIINEVLRIVARQLRAGA